MVGLGRCRPEMRVRVPHASSMSTLDLLGHLGYVLVFGGQLLISRGRPAGWGLRVAGDLLWICLGFPLGMLSISIWGTLFLVVDILALSRAWTSRPKRVDTRPGA